MRIGRAADALLVALALLVSGAVYATAADLAERVSDQLLAEAASPDSARVDGPLLLAALQTPPAWPDDADAAARDAARDAVASIDAKLQDATALIDGYLGTRYPNITNASLLDTLRVYCIDIALWRLLGGERDTDEYLAYRQATDWLGKVAAGQIGLNPDEGDDAVSAAAGARAQTGAALFTRRQLGGTGNGGGW